MRLPLHRRNARRAAILVCGLLAGLVGCATYESAPWRKDGANDQTVQRDNTECRGLARSEAQRRYPYRAGSPSLGAAGAVTAQQRDDTSRAVTEATHFNECMQGRGYRRGTEN
jgi:hypothetical protein